MSRRMMSRIVIKRTPSALLLECEKLVGVVSEAFSTQQSAFSQTFYRRGRRVRKGVHVYAAASVKKGGDSGVGQQELYVFASSAVESSFELIAKRFSYVSSDYVVTVGFPRYARDRRLSL
jgi:hypothetical protein